MRPHIKVIMVITPHLLVGAAIGAHSPNVWAAFCFGLISHYILDSLPHWEYLTSLKINKLNHFVRIFIDFVLSIVILLIASWPVKIIVLAGAFGAIFPDIIEFLYMSYNIKILRFLSLFHKKIHCYKRLSLIKGLPLQIIIILISIILLKLPI